MTLTLEEVKGIRFRMERRAPGYNVSDVDTFVDGVEATFIQMLNEQELLKRQLESLNDSQPEQFNGGEVERLRRETEDLRAQLARGSDQGEMERMNLLSAENESLRKELESARAQASQASQALASAQGQGASRFQHLVVTTSEEASPAVIRLVQLATGQAEQVVAEADAEAKRKIDEASQRAFEITTDARTRADRIESEARVNAEALTSEAQSRANKVESDAQRRRTELFAALETERDELTGKVEHLRGFESTYRNTLLTQLQRQLDQVQNSRFEPVDVPELLTDRDPGTPRLDALMGE